MFRHRILILILTCLTGGSAAVFGQSAANDNAPVTLPAVIELQADSLKLPLYVPGVDSLLLQKGIISRSYLNNRLQGIRSFISKEYNVPQSALKGTIDVQDFPELTQPFTRDTLTWAEGKDLPRWRMWVRYNKPLKSLTGDDLNLIPATEETKEPSSWWLKTNIPAWGLLITNIAVEVQTAEHWSVSVPAYYSGFNYFHRDTKFRCWGIIPELRYWFTNSTQGFFVGPHMGFAFYNVAFGKDKRYQDHGAKRPAWGGGVGVGYRWHFSRNHHWFFEATLGGGVYSLDYDIFKNEPNGLLMGRHKRTMYCIDQATFSVCYRFDTKKKGGRK